MKTLIGIGLLLFSVLLAQSQDRTLFDLNMKTGYEALAQSNYDRALKFISVAQKSPVLKQEKEVNLKAYVDELVPLIEKRKALGVINPSVRHKAMVLYVASVSGTYESKNKGKITVTKTLTEEDKTEARLRQGVIRQIYEGLSDGNFTIDFEEVMVTEPLQSIRLLDGEKPWPDWKNFEGAANIIRENFDAHDTFIWCSPFIQGEGHGGYGQFPLGQGKQSPQKGFIEVNPRFSVNLWIHEFFHVVENMVGISPSHGHHKENKSKFPDWPGNADNALNYYAWHFKTTIPTKGWDKLKINSKLPIEYQLEREGWKTIGTWSPGQVTNDWSVQEWNVESRPIEAGPLKVMMLYTSGWKAIDIAWVSLWHNGKEITIDEHFGFSGSKKVEHIYTLNVPQPLTGPYIIKAKVKGDNGTDSNGMILIRSGGQ